MEVVGAVASILTLIEATSVMHKFLKGAKSSRKELHNLERELAILYSLLLSLRNLRYPDTPLSDSTSKSTRNAIPVLEIEHGVIDEYSTALQNLHQKMAPKFIRDGPPSFFASFITKEAVKELLEKLNRLKSSISVILNVEQLKLAMTTLAKTTQAEHQYEGQEQTARRREALTWISSESFASRQVDLMSRLDKNTGTWFLDDSQFRNWVQTPKEILFANCIKSSQTRNLAWIFCDYKAERSQTVPQLLGSHLQQLVQNNSRLSGHLLDLHESHIERKTFPSSEQIFACLKAVVAEHTDVHVVVDALDELSSADNRRRKLLDYLCRLSSETDAVHLMVTSRPSPEIVDRLKGITTLEVKAAPEDVTRFVRGRFGDFRARLSSEWQARIEEAIVKSSDGMFLIAQFLVDRFAVLHNPRQVKALINDISNKLPPERRSTSTYDWIYEDTMKRINSQTEQDRELARKVIMWIANAARLLTTKELCCALSVEPGDAEFDPDNSYPVDLMLDVCAGLVIVDKQTNIIRFVHATAQEYFDRKKAENGETDSQQMATVCLTYLCFDQFRPEKPDPDSDAEDVLGQDTPRPFHMDPNQQVMRPGFWDSWVVASYNGSIRVSTRLSGPSSKVQSIRLADAGSSLEIPASHHFVDYAANHWAFHARDCQEAVAKPALRLLTNQELSAHAFLYATCLHEPWPIFRLMVDRTTQVTGLHLIAGLGLTSLLRELLVVVDETPNLHADAKDDDRRTALMWAAHHGHVETVKLLLARSDVRPNRKCSRGDTALNYAARGGWLVIVEMLLENDGMRSDCARWNCYGETALVQAALEGHRQIVQVLRQYDQESIHQEVLFGQWPIHIAAQRRPVSVIELLLDECCVDALIEDPKGYTPFVVAVDWNNDEVVRYFLKEKRHLLHEKPEQVTTAVHIAAANSRRLGVLRLIVEEVEWAFTACNKQGKTPLETAIDAGNTEAVTYLSNRALKAGGSLGGTN